MAQKRKATTAKENNNSRQQERLSRQEPDTSRFLDLPPEIRNDIYAYTLQVEAQALLITRSRGKLFSKSALARTNRLVRDEFTSLLQVAAFELVAEVKDFDFDHVITFLIKMKKSATSKLSRPLTPRLNAA